MFNFFTSLSASQKVLAALLALAVALGVLYQIGVVSILVGLVFRLLNGCVNAGFAAWRRLFSRLPWSALVGIIIGVHALVWLDDERHSVATLLVGGGLMLVGLICCLAYIFIDLERLDVGRGYKVLHNPQKGQVLAENLLRYGPRVGMPLLLAACVASISGFALVNLGLAKSFGRTWYSVGAHARYTRIQSTIPDHEAPPVDADYTDFLAYSVMNLLSAVDVIDLVNTYQMDRVTYVHQSRWQSSTLLVLFKSFFTIVLVQQIMSAVRYAKSIQESVKDFWSPYEPIQRRAGENLTQQGALAVDYLIRSMESAPFLTTEQRDLLPRIIASIGPTSVPHLLPHLRHANESVREIVVASLGQLQALETLLDFAPAHQDASERVRLSVTEALRHLSSLGAPAVRKRWQLQVAWRRARPWPWARHRRRDNRLEQTDPIQAIVAILRELVKDSSKAVRCGAAKALGQLGGAAGDAAEELLGLATDEDEAVRWQAAETLGLIQGPADETVAALIHLLEDSSPKVRQTAARALGARGAAAAACVPQLIPLVQDRDNEVRQAAADAIGQIGELAASSVPHLIAGLKNRDNLVRAQAAEALGMIGEAAAATVPSLMEALRDANDRVRGKAAWALGRMGSAAAPAVPALAAALRDEDFRVAARSAEALAAIGPDAVAAAPALGHALRHINPEVRLHACAALPRIGAAAAQVAEPLIALASDEDMTVRVSALQSLGAFAESPPSMSATLLAALADEAPQARTAAIIALGQHALKPAGLLDALLPSLDDANTSVKIEAARVLSQMPDVPKNVIDGLCKLLEDGAEEVQIAAATALGKLGACAQSAGDALYAVLQRGSPAVRECVLRAVVQIQPEQALSIYLVALHDSETDMRRLAAAGLIKIETLPQEAHAALKDALRDPDIQVRSTAAFIWAQQPVVPADLVGDLCACTAEPDDGLRLNALRALRTHVAELSTEVLQRLLTDPNPQVSFLAVDYLLAQDAAHAEASVLLIAALSAEMSRSRAQALDVLETLGARASAFIDALQERLKLETDPDLREQTAKILEKLSDSVETPVANTTAIA